MFDEAIRCIQGDIQERKQKVEKLEGELDVAPVQPLYLKYNITQQWTSQDKVMAVKCRR